MTARVLFHCAGRRGLGHAMRGANLARSVTAADPRASVLMHVTSAAAGVACPDVPWVPSDDLTPAGWRALVAAFRPSLVVFDTMLPGAWADDRVPRAFVWRRSVEVRHGSIAASAALQRMRLLLVPHDEREFGYPLPADLASRTVFTGPIVRGSDPEGQARVRFRYGLPVDAPLIVSTAGGGGFEGSAERLLEVATAAQDRLAAGLPGLRHLVFPGPLSSSPEPMAARLATQAGLTIVGADPDLVHLMAIADLVVAEAGYTTVQEIREVQVPAFLLPGDRTYDDQARRADDLACLGVARVGHRSSTTAAADALVTLALDRATLGTMRARARAHPARTGNARAAAALLDAAQ